VGRRAISAPTPPPAYQQTIHIPMVYMPSTPTTPSMMPMSIARTCSPSETPDQLPSACVDYAFPPSASGGPLQAFNQPQGWSPEGAACDGAYVNVFDIPFTNVPCEQSAVPFFKSSSSPSAYTNSSGPPSPVASPYTPTALETLHVTTDAWQAQSLPIFDVEPLPVSLEYQPYAWANAPDLWVNGSAPMFNEDFDISMIPPISIEVPKFDGFTHVVDQPCAQDFLSPQSVEQDGDAYAPVFTFNDVPEMALVDGF